MEKKYFEQNLDSERGSRRDLSDLLQSFMAAIKGTLRVRIGPKMGLQSHTRTVKRNSERERERWGEGERERFPVWVCRGPRPGLQLFLFCRDKREGEEEEEGEKENGFHFQSKREKQKLLRKGSIRCGVFVFSIF